MSRSATLTNVARYVRYEHHDTTSFGRIEGDAVVAVAGELGELTEAGSAPVPLREVALRAPVAPSKIIAASPSFGAFFSDAYPAPTQPTLWLKPATTVVGPDATIEMPPDEIVNFEGELAIVIGRRARHVAVADAADYIFGYTCCNDVTAGDLSDPVAWMASHYAFDGKLFDTFAPLGPVIETELDCSDLLLQTRVNGDVRQRHSTSDFLFSPERVVAVVSRVLTLLPGDVIATGSPPGLGPLRDGDVVEVDIEGIGVLRNTACASIAVVD